MDFWSDESRLQHIFRYHRIRKKEDLAGVGLSEEDSIPEFPIYVSLNPEAITFHFIGIKERVQKKKKRSKSDKQPEFYTQHYEALVLPLSSNLAVKDTLSETLRKVIDERLELDSSVYGFSDGTEMLKGKTPGTTREFGDVSVYYSNLEQIVDFSTRKTVTPGEVPESRLFASELPGSILEPVALDGDSTKIILLKRTLLLDFFFDFQHSKVFQNSPYFDEIESRLRENELLNAILSKCEYYFAREKYLLEKKKEVLLEKSKGAPRNFSEEVRMEWSGQLMAAERNFLNMIFSESSAELFYYSNGWLVTVEGELRAVLFNDNPRVGTGFMLWKKITEKWRTVAYVIVGLMLVALIVFNSVGLPNVMKSPNFFSTISCAFFLISIYSAVIYFFEKRKKENSRWARYRREEFLREREAHAGRNAESVAGSGSGNRIRSDAGNYPGNEVLPLRKQQRSINNFLLSRFDVANAYRHMLPESMRLPVFAGMVIWVFAILAWLFIFLVRFGALTRGTPDYETKLSAIMPQADAILLNIGFLGGGVGIGISVVYLLHRYIELNDPRHKVLYLFPGFLVFLVLYMTSDKSSIFFFAGTLYFIVFFLIIADDLIRKRYRFQSGQDWIKARGIPGWGMFLVYSSLCFLVIFAIKSWFFPTVTFQLILFVGIFFAVFSWVLSSRRESLNYYQFTFNLILPRMQMAIISSWLFFISSEELWKANLRVPFVILLCTVLLILGVATFYLAYVIINRTFELSWGALLLRTSTILAYGFLFSLMFGLVSMSFIGKEMLLNSGVEEVWNANSPFTELAELKAEVSEQHNRIIDLRQIEFDELAFRQLLEEFLYRSEVGSTTGWSARMLELVNAELKQQRNKLLEGLELAEKFGPTVELVHLADSLKRTVSTADFKDAFEAIQFPDTLEVVALKRQLGSVRAELIRFCREEISPDRIDAEEALVRLHDLAMKIDGFLERAAALQQQVIAAIDEVEAIFQKYRDYFFVTYLIEERVFREVDLLYEGGMLSHKEDSLKRIDDLILQAARQVVDHTPTLQRLFEQEEKDSVLLRIINTVEEGTPIRDTFLMIARDPILSSRFLYPRSNVYRQERMNDYIRRNPKRRIGIYPRLLILNALFALFIGVFIQVITQDRSVTESL